VPRIRRKGGASGSVRTLPPRSCTVGRSTAGVSAQAMRAFTMRLSATRPVARGRVNPAWVAWVLLKARAWVVAGPGDRDNLTGSCRDHAT
jgi:hypothetical protein